MLTKIGDLGVLSKDAIREAGLGPIEMGDIERKLIGMLGRNIVDKDTIWPNSLQTGEVIDPDSLMCY